MQHLRLIHTAAEAHRARIQASQRRGRIDLCLAGQAADQLRAEGISRAADAAQHLIAELEGARRRHDDRRGGIAGLAAVLVEHVVGDGRVRVDQIAVVAPRAADLLARLDVVAETAGKRLADLGKQRIGDGIPPLLTQLLHIARDLRVAAQRE